MARSQASSPKSYPSMGGGNVASQELPAQIEAASLEGLLSIATVHHLWTLQEGPYESFCFLNFLTHLMGFYELPPVS